MTTVKWDAISGYIDEAFNMKGRIEREDVIELAFNNHASDDVIDALDAIGSRKFNSASDVRDFLTEEGYVAKQ